MNDDLEASLRCDKYIMAAIIDRGFAEELYAALTNIKWFRAGEDTKDEGAAHCMTFRYAAGLIAEMRSAGENYMDFYCCSQEGVVSERIQGELNRIGWKWKAYGDEK